MCPCVECFCHLKPCASRLVLVMKEITGAVLPVRALRFAYETYLDEVSHCLRTYYAEFMTSTASGPSSSADTVMVAVPRSTTRQSARQRLQSILQGTLATFTTLDLEIGKTLFFLIVEMLMKACCPQGRALTFNVFAVPFPAQDSVGIDSSVLLRDNRVKTVLENVPHTDHLDYSARASCFLVHAGLVFAGVGTHAHGTPSILITKLELTHDMLGSSCFACLVVRLVLLFHQIDTRLPALLQRADIHWVASPHSQSAFRWHAAEARFFCES